MGLVETDGFEINGFAAPKHMKAVLRDLRDKNNRPIYTPALAGGSPATLWGENVNYAGNGGWDPSVAEMIAGDWTKAILGIRRDVELDILTEASLYDNSGNLQFALAQEGMVALMSTWRLGFEVANPVTRLNPTQDVTVDGVTTLSTRYPFAVLVPAGS
jgi:HK97 family phage major capsid protein